MASCSTTDLLAISNCFQCLAPGQLEMVKTALLCNILKALNPLAICNIQSLLDSAQCFQCLPPGQLALVQTALLCNIANAGGGSGGAVCLSQGSGAPVVAGTCPVSLYFDNDSGSKSSGTFWWWSTATAKWVHFQADYGLVTDPIT